MSKSEDILSVSKNAAATIVAIYEWVDRVNAAGGATSLSCIAACNAMLKSLKNNEKRVESLILEPIRKAIKEAEGR